MNISIVPVQYPQSSFPQFTDFETRKPFRALFLELMYKNYTKTQLVQRACQVVDYIMLPFCTSAHFDILDKGCDHNKKGFALAKKAKKKYGHGLSKTKKTKV